MTDSIWDLDSQQFKLSNRCYVEAADSLDLQSLIIMVQEASYLTDNNLHILLLNAMPHPLR